ncbi:MAG: tungstate transport system substrate-binding protein [Desulfobacteraceae bacterium Eth-SRB2]|nr:MAG: tungstate transport system substrate-binding protein [Desulfobacteraceae bacterium Eth-SRB2]
MNTEKKSIFQILFLQLLFFLAFISLAKGSDKQDFQATYGKGDQAICVATGSPGALGLLQALAEPFCQANHCRINWIKRGSGASLKALKAGTVDMVMVHAPALEQKAVKEGWATMRTLMGSNEFYVVGPKSDPAGISNAKFAPDAYERIAKARAMFFSRGDNSGTHKKEMKIWKLAGMEPAGNWYVVTGNFMGPTLMRADEGLGYFMTDSSTFFAKQSKIKNLKILFKGDPILVNVYHALVAWPETHPQKNYALAAKFVRFVSSPEGQKIFREYGKIKYGAPLYNDAEYAKKCEN